MYISKREPAIEELLSDPVMVTMLQHSRTTADDVRALLNGVRERLAKASAADTSHASVASSELPAVGSCPNRPFAAFGSSHFPPFPHH